MSPELMFQTLYFFLTISSLIGSVILSRDVLLGVFTDKVIQNIEQEEIRLDEAMRDLPDNVISLEMWRRADPYKEFVEEFLVFETVRKHDGMLDYATNRTRMIRKARRLLNR